MWRMTFPAHIVDNFLTIDEFARRAGRRAFYNANHLQGAIRQVIDGLRLAYLPPCYPTNVVW
jgi:hypothetical protein